MSQKRSSVFLKFFLILLTLAVLGCTPPTPSSAEQAPPITMEPLVEESATTEKVSVVEEIQKVAEVTKEPIPQELAQKQTLIFPTLTYDGAYNGPLYGTSEQVGSASMDSYFRLLDKNGINYFIGMFGIEGEPTINTLTSDRGLGEVIVAVQKHPSRIVPFFNPGIGGEEVEKYLGDDLTSMYTKTLAATKKIILKNFIP